MDKKDKQKFGKDMTDAEIKRVVDHREITNKTINNDNPIAHKLACLSDQGYNLFLEQMSSAEDLRFTALIQKKKIDRNARDREIGKTEQVFSTGVFHGEKKNLDDLESDNIITNNVLYKNIESLRQTLTNIFFSFVGVKRVGDMEVFFDEESFNKYVEKIVKKFRKVGIDLFVERQKQILKD